MKEQMQGRKKERMQGLLFMVLLTAGSLVALTGLRQFFIDPFSTTAANAGWFLIQSLPILAPLPTALHGSIRGMFFLCIASLLYFVHGVVIAFDPGMMWMAACEISFSLGLCAVSALYVRQAREQEASR
jgi:uncharacterized membrane protein